MIGILNRGKAPVRDTDLARQMSSSGVEKMKLHHSWHSGFMGLAYQGQLPSTRKTPALIVRKVQGGTFALLLDGRIDNRSALGRRLQIDRFAGMPDSEIVVRGYQRQGSDFLQHIRGPFSVLIADTQAQKIIGFRSQFVSPELYFYIGHPGVLIATEISSILPHKHLSSRLDEHWLADYFALRIPAGDRTIFADIRQLYPGELLECGLAVQHRSRQTPRLGQQMVRYQTDHEYAVHYREILGQAVARVCETDGNVGIMLSSGLDSGPLAYVAKNKLARCGRSIKAYSWSLKGYPEADESEAIKCLANHAGIELNLVEGEAGYNPSEGITPFLNPNTPVTNLFQGLKNVVYRAASDNGCGVLLSGAYGDSLYPDPSYWFLDALMDKQWSIIGRESKARLQSSGLKGLLLDPALKRALKHGLKLPHFRTQSSPWLTKYALDSYEANSWPPEQTQARLPDFYASVLGAACFSAVSSVCHFSHPYRIEVRDPYLDWELADFMLSIPVYQTFRNQTFKYIARLAMLGILPEDMRASPRRGRLDAFFRCTMVSLRDSLYARLSTEKAVWHHYVTSDWIWCALQKDDPSAQELLLIWQCFAFEEWRHTFNH